MLAKTLLTSIVISTKKKRKKIKRFFKYIYIRCGCSLSSSANFIHFSVMIIYEAKSGDKIKLRWIHMFQDVEPLTAVGAHH